MGMLAKIQTKTWWVEGQWGYLVRVDDGDTFACQSWIARDGRKAGGGPSGLPGEFVRHGGGCLSRGSAVFVVEGRAEWV